MSSAYHNSTLSQKNKEQNEKRLFCDAFKGIPQFSQTVSFLQEQRVKVCAFTKTYRLSRFVRYHENQTDLSPELPEHLQYQKVYSEKLMFFHLVPQYC